LAGGKVRLATFELAILLLKSLVYSLADRRSFLQDDHLAAIEGAREEATLLMRNFYKVWEKVSVCCLVSFSCCCFWLCGAMAY